MKYIVAVAALLCVATISYATPWHEFDGLESYIAWNNDCVASTYKQTWNDTMQYTVQVTCQGEEYATGLEAVPEGLGTIPIEPRDYFHTEGFTYCKFDNRATNQTLSTALQCFK